MGDIYNSSALIELAYIPQKGITPSRRTARTSSRI